MISRVIILCMLNGFVMSQIIAEGSTFLSTRSAMTDSGSGMKRLHIHHSTQQKAQLQQHEESHFSLYGSITQADL